MARMHRLFCSYPSCRSVPSYEVLDRRDQLVGTYCAEHGQQVFNGLVEEEETPTPQPSAGN